MGRTQQPTSTDRPVPRTHQSRCERAVIGVQDGVELLKFPLRISGGCLYFLEQQHSLATADWSRSFVGMTHCAADYETLGFGMRA